MMRIVVILRNFQCLVVNWENNYRAFWKESGRGSVSPLSVVIASIILPILAARTATLSTTLHSLGALHRGRELRGIVGVIRLIPALCHRAPSTAHPGNKQIMNRVPTRVDKHPISAVHLPPSPPKSQMVMKIGQIYLMAFYLFMAFLTSQFQAICHLSPFVERDHLPFFKMTVMENTIMPWPPSTPLNNVQFQRLF